MSKIRESEMLYLDRSSIHVNNISRQSGMDNMISKLFIASPQQKNFKNFINHNEFNYFNNKPNENQVIQYNQKPYINRKTIFSQQEQQNLNEISDLLINPLSQNLPGYRMPEKIMSPNSKKRFSHDKYLKSLKKYEISKYQMELVDQKKYATMLNSSQILSFGIVEGKVITKSEEYKQLQRAYENEWKHMAILIQKCEKFCEGNKINYAKVNANKLFKFKDKKRMERGDYFGVFDNYPEIRKLLCKRFSLFDEFANQLQARVIIKRCIRNYIIRRDKKRHQALMRCYETIKAFVKHLMLRKKIKNDKQDQINQIKEKFQQQQMKFHEIWPSIRNKTRVEIHMNSLNYSELGRLCIDNYQSYQNAQINRMYRLRDPNLTIILLMPFKPDYENQQFYYEQLENMNVRNYRSRLHFVWPNKHLLKQVANHFPLAKLLFYSGLKVRNQIKNIIKDRFAYIVPGIHHYDNEVLSNYWKIPIFIGNPEIHERLNSKSQVIDYFRQISFPTALGQTGIKSRQALIQALTFQIVNFNEIGKWLVKLNYDHSSKGVAMINLDTVQDLQPYKSMDKYKLEIRINDINAVVKRHLNKLLTIIDKKSYPTTKDFMIQLEKQGALLESVPDYNLQDIKAFSLSFLIEPSGEILPISSYDKLPIKDFVNYGASYPQSSIDYLDQEKMMYQLGKSLTDEQILGFITIDFISFPDPKTPKEKLFLAVGMDTYLNQYTSAAIYLEYSCNQHYDCQRNRFYLKNALLNYNNVINTKSIEYIEQVEPVKNNKEKLSNDYIKYTIQEQSQLANLQQNNRVMIYIPFLFNQNFSDIHYNYFVQTMMFNQIDFDPKEKLGIQFQIMSPIQIGLIGITSIGKDFNSALNYINSVINIIASIKSKNRPIMENISRQFFYDQTSKFHTLRYLIEGYVDGQDQKNQNQIKILI